MGGFHPDDIKRVDQNVWLSNFLEYHDYNLKEAARQCWDTLEWRKQAEVNEISESTVQRDYLIDGNIYIRGRDRDGKIIMFFKIGIYTRGSKTIEHLKRYLIYWIERSHRASNGEQITIVFDMLDTGMRNIDMEYTRFMIMVLKNYYPNSLHYLLVYDMPWVLNGVFQIIKGLLPKKVIDRLKFINAKNASNFIDAENMPYEWEGGKDMYELKFESENFDCNNNSSSINPHGEEDSRSQRKVHFAQSESPMSEISNSSSYDTQQHYGDMLQLSPAETILFQKNNNNEYAGNVEILNISKKAITYKVKTTAPDKFRVRPSSGTLSTNSSATINVVIQKGFAAGALPVNKDKFLVMCMYLDGESQTNDEIATMWKEVTASSPDVEQHRLKCTMPANVTAAIINNNNESIADYFLDGTSSTLNTSSVGHSVTHNGTKQTAASSHTQHLQITVDRLTDCVNHMQQQVKSLQSLQWITIFVFIMLSIAIVYILKMEIQNSNSQYCIDNE